MLELKKGDKLDLTRKAPSKLIIIDKTENILIGFKSNLEQEPNNLKEKYK